MHASILGETGVGTKRVGSVLCPEWFTPRDARLLGRLRTGLPVTDVDLTDASREFRPIAARILAAPLSDRPAIADHWLAGYAQADAEAIQLAVIHTDPAQPPEALAGREEALARSLGLDVRMTRASEIAPRPVDWLWRGRVPLGMLTMFAGDPKLGKSFVTLAVAAAVSRGAPLPGGDVPAGPASAIVLSAEDDPARTIVPRLIAAGADLSRVHILKSVILDNRREAPPRLDTALAALAAAIERVGDCRLILIDPITAHLGQVDDHRNADLRSVLSPLNDMAERLRVAVVLVSHLSKRNGINGKHRVMGSIAYVGACRANFLFVRDRTDPTGRRVLIGDNGGNLGPAAPTLAYTIEEREHGVRVAFLDEPVALTVEQALADEVEAGQDHRQASECREAEQWLREVLAAGPVSAKELEDAARNCGIALRTLKRAKEQAGARSYRQGFGRDAQWFWSLLEARLAPPSSS